MIRRPALDRPARRMLTVAAIATGVAIALAASHRPSLALTFAAIAAGTTLSVVRHLLNLGEK